MSKLPLIRAMSRTIAFSLLSLLATFATAQAGDMTILQVSKSFHPKSVTVAAGTTLIFVNNDYYDHNVYSETKGNTFNIGVQRPGETTRIDLSQKGEVMVRCRIHPKMHMKVTVTE